MNSRLLVLNLVIFSEYSQLEHDAHALAPLVGIIQLYQPRVPQPPHDVHLSLHITSLVTPAYCYQLGGELEAGRLLAAEVDCAEFTAAGGRRGLFSIFIVPLTE